MKGKEKEMYEQDHQEIPFFADPSDDENDMLTLSLSFPSSRSELVLSEQLQQPTRRYESSSSSQSVPQQSPMQMFFHQRAPQPPPSSPSQQYIRLASAPTQPLYMPSFVGQDPSSSSARLFYHSQEAAVGPSRPLRDRRNPTQGPGEEKSDYVHPPFPWATSQPATVYSLTDLHSKQILTITGEVQCKKCERQYTLEYNLKQKLNEVGTFILENRNNMHERAPPVWMNPVLPTCKFCNKENSAKPIIANEKGNINWLFLLLGQMLGCCTLEQLKYFCKHTRNHRTGAKDRVLYLTYLSLCKQLDPSGPFNR